MTLTELSGMDRRIQKRFWTQRRLAYVGIALLVSVVIVYGFFTLTGSTLRVDANRLTISTVTEGAFQEFIPVTGTVTPLKTFYLDAVEGGTVVEVFVEQGTLLKVGDPILRLENTDVRMDIMYREAQLFEQINNLRNTRLAMEQRKLQLSEDLLEVDRSIRESQRQYNTAAALHDKGMISDDEFNRTEETLGYWTSKHRLTIETQKQDSVLRSLQVEQLESSVSRMQANLEFFRDRLGSLMIKAPLSGQLTSLNAEIGESKRAGERLGQIDNLDGFKLQADVDEYYVSRINVGQSASTSVAGQDCLLEVSKVYPEIASGRFQVDFEFAGQPPPDLRRGQTVQIRLALGDLSQAVMLPRGGFYNATGGRWAFVVAPGSSEAVRQEIHLGRQNSEAYEVLGGLKPGDRVITSSYEALSQYDKIILE